MAVEFGRDITCTDSLRTGRFSTGLRLVAEACYRRLITPRGTLRGGEDERNYGTDLTAYVGKGAPRKAAAALPGIIRSELLKDERVEAVDVDVLTVTEGPATTLPITVNVTTAAGPFELQLLASAVTVELLRVST